MIYHVYKGMAVITQMYSIPGRCGEPAIDGINQSDMIINGGDGSRKEMVYNLDIHSDKFAPIAGYAAYR